MHTRKENRHALSLLFGALVLASFAGCYSDPAAPAGRGSGGMDSLGGSGGAAGEQESSAGEGPMGGEAGAPARSGKCVKVAGEALPQRSSILSQEVEPTQREIFVAEVYSKFLSDCGACHAKGQGLGGFRVPDSSGYATVLKEYVPKMLERIQSDDRLSAMPPLPVVPYSKLAKGDSLRSLAHLLTEWQGAGFTNPFYEKLATTPGQNQYAMTTEQGLGFTNIGTCVPEGDFPFASDQVTMKALDEAFARRVESTDLNASPEDKIGLPVELSDTDLTSFDSEILARTGLAAFAPTYPLWSDDAGKLRYVRVPLGESIRFDAKTQKFDIPDNTRFYKTFMKEVTDKDGSKRWRKLETRLIVARHDSVSPKDVANYKPRSLFGTYKWDEAETHATLLTDKLRNGEPFTDDLIEYVIDEPKALEIRAKMPANLSEELQYNKTTRHWAIPGKTRCVHCHEGSMNDNFILGFTPMQISRRKLGEGGVYEHTSEDELGQFQRLIDLGVITGVKSNQDVVKLEDSQLDATPPRKPRNDAELKAQAYLLANCAHCHNQNGFPSVANPELTNVFNLQPGKRPGETTVGGVFQFPLETFSPRISRVVPNPGEDTKIAYITPSLHDIEGRDELGVHKFDDNTDPNSSEARKFINLPWRSLIYRNVHTPFTYSDAKIVYPHMPFDSAGHDCRAAQWLGEWMVSIPAERKHPELSESCVEPTCQDIEPQPYVEVLPGAASYASALSAAKKRLATFTNDLGNKRCVDTSDIVDPDVLPLGPHSRPRDVASKDYPIDGVPDRAHWVVTDLTERAGLWTPRRDDWKKVLIDHEYPPPGAGPGVAEAFAAQKAVVELLGSRHLADVKAFANSKFPLTLWKNKPGCKLDSERAVNSYQAAERPLWFEKANADPEARVFQVHPGQAVFDMICTNCHGPNADSLGRQADLLQTMTGGRSRVANFRSGLFNPVAQDDPYDKPDLGLQVNRPRVFGPYSTDAVSADDWGARYLAWMALGGTQAEIPQVVLDQVAATGNAGLGRNPLLRAKGANMLQVAQGACLAVQGYGSEGAISDPIFHFRERKLSENPLIGLNGDEELWRKTCALANSFIVRAIAPHVANDNTLKDTGSIVAYATKVCDSQGQPAPCYPMDALVGDQRSETVSGLDTASNTFAWCVSRGFGKIPEDQLQAFAQANLFSGKPLPICPASWEAAVAGVDDRAESKVWADRGAINAGFLVFDFLDKFIKGEMGHVQYNQCELLPAK